MLKKPHRVKKIYFDNSATTPVDKAVIKEMMPYFSEKYGNPSALYSLGREARAAVENARKKISNLIGANPENIIFTSGGTESDNLALHGLARAHEYYGRHAIAVASEHQAVLKPLEDLVKLGWEVTYVRPDKDGFVNPEEIIKAIAPDTVFITIMYANNETGVIQPLAEIGKEIIKYRKANNIEYPYFHTDACQAAGYLDLNVEKTHVDLMTLNSGKIYGPKGVGALYLRRGVKIKPQMFGGEQESNRRGGTENVPGIVGFVKALEISQEMRNKESKRLRELIEYFWKRIADKIPDVKLNGPENFEKRLPNILNVSFKRVEGEAMLLYLDEYGISCSTGSACTSASLTASHVLRSMGISDELAHGSLRFSLGRHSKKKDVDYVMTHLPEIVKFLRELSPLK